MVSDQDASLFARHRYSLLTIGTLAILMIVARLWAPYWDTRNVQAILTWDAMGYYLYLPAHFLYHDLRTLAFIPKIMAEYGPSTSFYQAFQVPGAPVGHLVMKYPIGLAILEAPFFGIGHVLARWLGYPTDGFSAPYQASIAFGGIAYAVAGLALLRRVLLRYFTDAITALTLLALALATNYFQYAVFDAAMAHAAGFTLYALLLWSTVKWHEAPRRRWAIGIGAALGLLVLVRPSDMVAVLLPILWGVGSGAAVRAKLAMARRHWLHLALAAVVGLLAVSPQLLYWKWSTGHWIFYSYQEQGFSWLSPHLKPVLVSFRKGWLIYTPLMILALIGFIPLWKQHRTLAIAVAAYAAVNLWIVAAWDIWWYGGSFGQRAMVQSYAALSLPLAALLTFWLTPAPQLEPRSARGLPWYRLLALPALVGFAMLNLFQTWQYMSSIIVPEDMTKPYWRAIFLNAQPTQADYALLTLPKARPGLNVHWTQRAVGKQTFDELTPETGGVPGEGVWKSTAYRLQTGSNPYSPALEVTGAALRATPGAWLRAGGSVWSEWGAWGASLVIELKRGDQQFGWYRLNLQNRLCINRHWNQIYGDIPLPADFLPTDVVRVYGWAPPGASSSLLDDLTLEVADYHQ
jgi:hypothetical protein